MRRLRGSKMSIPFDKKRVPENAVGMWVTTTPDDIGSDLYDFFENPDERNPNSKVYRMCLDDNAENLEPEYIAEMKRTHTGPLYERYIEGLFVGLGGGAFGFDYSIHVVDKGEFDDEPYLLRQGGAPLLPLEGFERRVGFGVDFGWTAASAIIPTMFDGDDRVFVPEEFYGSRMSPQGLVNECTLMEGIYGRGTFWCDSSRPDNITIMSREGLDARPNKSKRDDGIAELGGRFPDAGDGFRRIYIARECVNLIKELQVYNPDRKEFDHATDALRYGVMGGKGVSGGIQVLTGRRAPW